MFPLVGFTITNSNFFQSIDKPWIAIVTSLSRQVLFLAPMIYIIPPLFVNMGGLGLTGVWASMTISDMMGALLAFVLMLSQRKVFRPTA
jgi:Na+-driven multidrug efflux pump